MNIYEEMCSGIQHTIKAGDTLYRLSRLYGVSVERIMEANPKGNIYNLQIGETICIPLQPDVEKKEEKQGEWTMYMPYVTREGDSLNRLLEDFDMTFDEFASENPKIMPIPLKMGTTVYVKRNRRIVR